MPVAAFEPLLPDLDIAFAWRSSFSIHTLSSGRESFEIGRNENCSNVR